MLFLRHKKLKLSLLTILCTSALFINACNTNDNKNNSKPDDIDTQLNHTISSIFKLHSSSYNQLKLNHNAVFKNGILISTGAKSNTKNLSSFELQELENKANQGDLASILRLAQGYFDGDGVEQNYQKAFVWVEKAAKLNHPRAQKNLGHMYLDGLGVKIDNNLAIYWIEKAAQQNLAEAIFLLGQIYLNQEQSGKAINYIQKAADLGYADAQNTLGKMYLHGYGLPKNYTEAIKYFSLAELNDHVDALNNLGLCYLHGFGVETSLYKAKRYFERASAYFYAPAQTNLANMHLTQHERNLKVKIKLDPQEGLKLLQEASEQNYAPASYQLGLIYLHGYSINKSKPITLVAPDLSLAQKYLEIAAKGKDIDALNELGLMYVLGQGVSKEVDKGLRYLKQAAVLGSPLAMRNLAMLYAQGQSSDIEPNDIEALKWYEKAAQLNDIPSTYEAGSYYLFGSENIAQDFNQAFKLLSLASQKNYGAASNDLALMYQNGLGREANLIKAQDLFLKAIQDNCYIAALNLAHLYLNPPPNTQNFTQDKAKASKYLKLACQHDVEQACSELKNLTQEK